MRTWRRFTTRRIRFSRSATGPAMRAVAWQTIRSVCAPRCSAQRHRPRCPQRRRSRRSSAQTCRRSRSLRGQRPFRRCRPLRPEYRHWFLGRQGLLRVPASAQAPPRRRRHRAAATPSPCFRMLPSRAHQVAAARASRALTRRPLPAMCQAWLRRATRLEPLRDGALWCARSDERDDGACAETLT